MTPYYLFDKDAEDFHRMYKDVCEKNPGTYDKCKKWCDDYFYLPAREEHRGVGGIFFDDLSSLSSFSYPHVTQESLAEESAESLKKNANKELDDAMDFTQAVCDS